MNKTEILAPAGGQEQLIAAVRCGADAVYLGTQRFNARNSAANFSAENLCKAVAYCHERNVSVYVTMNTLVTDSEVGDVVEEIKMIAESGADAVIIQDLGVAALWKKYCPSMKLHASTQMTVHNLSGAKEAERLGFSRIVLARELSFEEIKTIAENVNAEIEVFVHGALCMSVSGTCLLSSMIGSRSGNRGRCAQPCRLNFNVGGREYALSLKDLSLAENIKDLENAGVKSFKIEGRMKRPEYVAAAVTAIRNAREGKKVDMESLRAVFSRSGFTKGYFEGKRTLEMFGYRRHEDVTAMTGILKEMTALYKDEISKIPLDISFSADRNGSRAVFSDGTNDVTVTGDVPENARTKPLDDEFVRKCMSKLGGTYFYLDNIVTLIDDGLSLSASQLNNMRREGIEKLMSLRQAKKHYEIITPEEKKKTFSAVSRTQTIRMRFELFSQSFDDEKADKIILPMTEILKHPESVEMYGRKLICELPFLVFGADEEKFLACLEKLRVIGVKSVIADNIGTLSAAKKAGFTVHGGHGLNVLNSVALEEYVSLGCADITTSPELMMTYFDKLVSPVPKGVIGYGYLPLMRFRACPAQGRNGCRDCKGFTTVKDRLGIDFYIICSSKKYSSLLNSVPVYIGDKPHGKADFVTLYFTAEKQNKCKAVLDTFCSGQTLSAKKTGGLYYRELL